MKIAATTITITTTTHHKLRNILKSKSILPFLLLYRKKLDEVWARFRTEDVLTLTLSMTDNMSKLKQTLKHQLGKGKLVSKDC